MPKYQEGTQQKKDSNLMLLVQMQTNKEVASMKCCKAFACQGTQEDGEELITDGYFAHCWDCVAFRSLLLSVCVAARTSSGGAAASVPV